MSELEDAINYRLGLPPDAVISDEINSRGLTDVCCLSYGRMCRSNRVGRIVRYTISAGNPRVPLHVVVVLWCPTWPKNVDRVVGAMTDEFVELTVAEIIGLTR